MLSTFRLPCGAAFVQCAMVMLLLTILAEGRAHHVSVTFNQDDGSCLYPDDVSGPECPADLNGDDLVGVSNLLILLGEFDAICTP